MSADVNRRERRAKRALEMSATLLSEAAENGNYEGKISHNIIILQLDSVHPFSIVYPIQGCGGLGRGQSTPVC